MSSTPETPDSLQALRQTDYFKFKRYAAWTFVIGSPILIALPPRRLNLNTVALASAFAVSANYLYKDKYQNSEDSQDSRQSRGFSNLFNALPTEKAQEVQAKLRASKEAAVRKENGEEGLEKYQTAKRFEDRSLPEKIWMGSETEGWKEKRLREEQKALDEGKGYGDLIMDHIWEVWNWGKPGDQKKREEAIAQKENEGKS